MWKRKNHSALSARDGETLEGNVWYPFGRSQTASPQATFQVSSRFTGQILDAETGLYYYGARYYDPELGRFIQADTIIPDLSNPQSYNRYAYTLNNPLRYRDPSGHTVEDVVNAIGNFAAGTIIGVAGIINPVPVQLRPDLPPPGTSAEYYGRMVGETVGAGIAVGEMLVGGTLLFAGAGTEVFTLDAATPVAVPVAVVGAGVATHGGIGINNYVFAKRNSNPGTPAAPRGSANPKTRAAANYGSSAHADKPGKLPGQLE